jgi:hygromycin-B 7''-O-kinase
MPLLPAITTQSELDEHRNQSELWAPAIAAIAKRHDLGGEAHLYATGSAVVFAVGDHVVKLHEPFNRDHYTTEATCLELLTDRLPIASPRLHVAAELEGWGYLVMDRLPGCPLSEARPAIPANDMLAIAAQTGELAAAIQAIAVPDDFAPFAPWNQFIAKQRANLVAHHRRADLPAALLATIEDELVGVDLTTSAPVLLHTELSDTNLMVEEQAAGWRLSGVFDFEPSMLGHPLYDLPAITMFVASGRPELCAAALSAYGVTADDELRRQLLACTLLHRYSHLGFFLAQTGITEIPPSWAQIATHLLGF